MYISIFYFFVEEKSRVIAHVTRFEDGNFLSIPLKINLKCRPRPDLYLYIIDLVATMAQKSLLHLVKDPEGIYNPLVGRLAKILQQCQLSLSAQLCGPKISGAPLPNGNFDCVS